MISARSIDTALKHVVAAHAIIGMDFDIPSASWARAAWHALEEARVELTHRQKQLEAARQATRAARPSKKQ